MSAPTGQLKCGPYKRTPTPASVVLMLLAVAAPTNAQQALKWENIRDRDPVTATDRSDMQRWVDERVEKLLATADEQTAREQGYEFFATIQSQQRAVNATNAFRDAIAEIVAKSFTSKYQPPKSNLTPAPISRVYILKTLEELGKPSALEAYLGALADPASGPRFVAASGLAALAGQMTGPAWLQLLPTVEKAAATETNSAVLRRLYSILLISTAPKMTDALPVVLRIVEARGQRADEKGLPPLNAEGEAVFWLGDRHARVSEARQKNDIVQVLARAMTRAVYARLDLALPEEARRDCDIVILAAETKLAAIVNKTPRPDVSSLLAKGDKPQSSAVLSELEKWIGSAGADGILNAAPYNLPRGLNLKRPAAAGTTTASQPGG